jgi:hypothetical protein
MSTIIIPQAEPKSGLQISLERAHQWMSYLQKIEAGLRPPHAEGEPSTSRLDPQTSETPYGETIGKLREASRVLLFAGPLVEVTMADLKSAATGPVESKTGLLIYGDTPLHEKLRSHAGKIDRKTESTVQQLRGVAGRMIGMICADIDKAHGGSGKMINFHRAGLPGEIAHWRQAIQLARDNKSEDDAESLQVVGKAARVLQQVEGPRGYWRDDWMEYTGRTVLLYSAINTVYTVLTKNGQITPANSKEAGKEAVPGQEEGMNLGAGAGKGATRTASVSKDQPLVQVYQPADMVRPALGYVAGQLFHS